MSESISKYLAKIGRKGGENSRRTLTRSQSREMVAIREMKRAAARKGDMEKARKSFKLRGPKTNATRRKLRH